jgi:hypothetical protein
LRVAAAALEALNLAPATGTARALGRTVPFADRAGDAIAAVAAVAIAIAVAGWVTVTVTVTVTIAVAVAVAGRGGRITITITITITIAGRGGRITIAVAGGGWITIAVSERIVFGVLSSLRGIRPVPIGLHRARQREREAEPDSRGEESRTQTVHEQLVASGGAQPCGGKPTWFSAKPVISL